MRFILTLSIFAFFSCTTVMSYPEAMVTKPAYTFREVARRSSTEDPLSNLISVGISAGNSILSDIFPPETTSTTTSSATSTPATSTSEQVPSRPTQSGSHPTAQNSHSSPSKPPKATAADAAHSGATGRPAGTSSGSSITQSGSGVNNRVVIILSAVLGVLAIILVGLTIWCCIRRRRRNKRNDGSGDDSSLGSTRSTKPLRAEQRLLSDDHHIQEHEIPMPPAEMSDTSRRRTSCQYWSPDDVSPDGTPFLTPPLRRRSSDVATPNDLPASSENNDTPISPITPNEPTQHQRYPQPPAELDSVVLPSVPRRSSRRSRVHYPSAAEMSKFDFGFNRGKHTPEMTSKRPTSFLIPRRPVGMNSTRFSA